MRLGFSLGKLNYCLKALKKKGLIKIKNFKNNKIRLIIFIFLLRKVLPKEFAHSQFYEKENERIRGT